MEVSATELSRKRKLEASPSSSRPRKNRRKLGRKNKTQEAPEPDGLSAPSVEGTLSQQKRSEKSKKKGKSKQGTSTSANGIGKERQKGRKDKEGRHDKQKEGGKEKHHERQQAVATASHKTSSGLNRALTTKHKRAPQEISSANKQILGSRLSRWSITTSKGGRYLELPALFSPSEESYKWAINIHRIESGGDRSEDSTKAILQLNKPIQTLKVVDYGRVIVALTPDSILVGISPKPRAKSVDDVRYEWREVRCAEPPLSLDVRCTKISRVSEHSALNVVVGGLKGCIYVYQDLLEKLNFEGTSKKDRPISTDVKARELHWHREGVPAVSWSNDGSYIISGGRETVLVLWQLDTGRKQFLPHLESPIRTLRVSPSGSSYAVGLGDNSVMVISTAEMKPITNIAGLQSSSFSAIPKHQLLMPTKELLSQVTNGFPNSFVDSAINPSNPSQLLITVPAHQEPNSVFPAAAPTPYLQSFDIHSHRHLSRQALTRTNATNSNISPQGTHINEPSVKHIQLGRGGRWLMSVDEWQPPLDDLDELTVEKENQTEEVKKYEEIHLRFWLWNESEKFWEMNSRIDAPHQLQESRVPTRVLATATNPGELSFATLGADCMVRIWAPRTKGADGKVVKADRLPKKDRQKSLTWWALYTCIPLDRAAKREDPAQFITPSRACMAFSNDGSALAVSTYFAGNESSDRSRVHFIDVEAGVLQETRHDLFDLDREMHAAKQEDNSDEQKDTDADGILQLAFLERYLICLGYSSLKVWDVTNYRQCASTTLDSLIGASEHPQDDNIPIKPPSPHLAVNLQTSTFAVSVALRITDSASTRSQAKSIDLPPHPYRDFTSQIFIFNTPSTANGDSLSNSTFAPQRLEPVFSSPPLPCLVLSLLSASGVSASPQLEQLKAFEEDGADLLDTLFPRQPRKMKTRNTPKNKKNGALNVQQSGVPDNDDTTGATATVSTAQDLLRRANAHMALAARKKGYVILDANASIRELKSGSINCSSAQADTDAADEEEDITAEGKGNYRGAMIADADVADESDKVDAIAEKEQMDVDSDAQARAEQLSRPHLRQDGAQMPRERPKRRVVRPEELEDALHGQRHGQWNDTDAVTGESEEKALVRNAPGQSLVGGGGGFASVREMFEGIVGLFNGKSSRGD
ncbi:MAG: hypothetical protein M1831_007343 [Alyxoria varia]|nr:MAG: hypothetical protein M1831_007343 [Alyxoria varia]